MSHLNRHKTWCKIGINIVLNAADGSPYAQATVGMSSVIVQETHYTMGLEGSVGPLELKDARQTTAITRDPLIHTSKQPVGTFAHQKWKRQHPSKPNYNESLTLRLNTIQIKYNEDLIFGLVKDFRNHIGTKNNLFFSVRSSLVFSSHPRRSRWWTLSCKSRARPSRPCR